MERRVSLRARTDFSVIKHDGSFRARCRGVELSSTGIIVANPTRRSGQKQRDERMLVGLELLFPERHRPVRAVARPVWAFGAQQAFKFIRMDDADRLTVAEHLDVLRIRGVQLC